MAPTAVVPRVVHRLGRAGIRRFRPRGGHQNSPFRGQDYMIPYMVGKLVPNPTHHTRGLVKYVPGRSYFDAVPSQNRDKFVTYPAPSTVERVPTAVATAMVPTVVASTVTVAAMVATVMAPTVVPTITVDTAVPVMKRCQLDSRLAAAASVTTFHHGRRQHLIAATTDLCSRQTSEKTASPLRLRTGVTGMNGISMVFFLPFSVVRNRVLAPLPMSCSSQLRSRAFFPTSCLRFSRRNVLALQP